MRNPQKLLEAYASDAGRHLFSARPDRFAEPTADRLLSISLVWLAFRVRSPLEELFGVRLIEEFSRRRTVTWDPRSREEWPSVGDLARMADGVQRVTLCCNLTVDRFRFDFWIRYVNCVTVVECDGLAWHWGKTLVRDRQKDELAEEFDWRMFRFDSGRILSDERRCVEKVVDYVLEGRVSP